MYTMYVITYVKSIIAEHHAYVYQGALSRIFAMILTDYLPSCKNVIFRP